MIGQLLTAAMTERRCTGSVPANDINLFKRYPQSAIGQLGDINTSLTTAFNFTGFFIEVYRRHWFIYETVLQSITDWPALVTKTSLTLNTSTSRVLAGPTNAVHKPMMIGQFSPFNTGFFTYLLINTVLKPMRLASFGAGDHRLTELQVRGIGGVGPIGLWAMFSLPIHCHLSYCLHSCVETRSAILQEMGTHKHTNTQTHTHTQGQVLSAPEFALSR
jgi:hypothetical protein